MTLFRSEALDAQRQRLHGDVFLTSPVSFKVVTAVLAALCVLALTILFTGSYTRVERVPGYLVPTGGLVKIQAGRFGSLSALHVGEGDLVQKGDALVSVEAASLTANGMSVESSSLQTLAEQQLNLENQIVLEESQLASEIGRIRAEMAAARLLISSLDSQIALQKEITKSTKSAVKDVEGILDKGFISKVEFEHRRQNWLNQQAQERLKEQERESARSQLAQLEIKLKQLPGETKSRIAQVRGQLLDIDTREAELLGQEAYVIKAPVAGRITSITSHTIGQSVVPEQPILTLMPEGSQLIAELFVPSRAIGFVEEGQETRLLYAAFPYQRFGSYPAEILKVTKTILSPREAVTPFELTEPFYRVTAALAAETLNIDGNTVALQSGMQLEANIIQERQSFVDWLLQPIRALRERS
ncbi:HlyD family efflux transporter periplasmic adaptor subunit [uncultured Tateyamaria sp.]|uniref:HlyD family efflux transporter periplasmic adaptor subunit n=1 Tax=uncultured Tateyamaria sp. TaxID=455651 RepID=UPI002636A4B6|nr:HlyD family efflux transporter periplasmic adaptor subunit [uncultured Tateyamaria sp.]